MHEAYTKLMSLILDGEGTPIREARLWKHLARCRMCRGTWENWQGVHRLMEPAPCALPPQILGERILAGLRPRNRGRGMLASYGAGLVNDMKAIRPLPRRERKASLVMDS